MFLFGCALPLSYYGSRIGGIPLTILLRSQFSSKYSAGLRSDQDHFCKRSERSSCLLSQLPNGEETMRTPAGKMVAQSVAGYFPTDRLSGGAWSQADPSSEITLSPWQTHSANSCRIRLVCCRIESRTCYTRRRRLPASCHFGPPGTGR